MIRTVFLNQYCKIKYKRYNCQYMLTKGDRMKWLDTFIEEFNQCRPVLTAVGDQTKQRIKNKYPVMF